MKPGVSALGEQRLDQRRDVVVGLLLLLHEFGDLLVRVDDRGVIPVAELATAGSVAADVAAPSADASAEPETAGSVRALDAACDGQNSESQTAVASSRSPAI